MKFDNLSQTRINARQPLLARHQTSHTRISRRKFIAATAGASVLGSGLFRPLSALAAPGIGDLLPVPNTLNVFGVDIHVQVPPKTGPIPIRPRFGISKATRVLGLLTRRRRRPIGKQASSGKTWTLTAIT